MAGPRARPGRSSHPALRHTRHRSHISSTILAIACLQALLRAPGGAGVAAASIDSPPASQCGRPPPQCEPYARLLAPAMQRRGEYLAAGGITAEDLARARKETLEGEGAYVTIRGGQIYVRMTREGWETRTYSNLLLLQRAATWLGRGSLPDTEFALHVGDWPKTGPSMSYCSKRGTSPGSWLWPDWCFWAWPEVAAPPWEVLRARVREVTAALPFEARAPRPFWRGGAGDHLRSAVRLALLSRYGDRHDVADVARIPKFDVVRQGMAGDPAGFNVSSLITRLEDFCRHKYIIYTEGNTWSARLKYHMMCGSVLLSHPREYDSLESMMLEEGVHVFTVDAQWEGLEAVWRRLEAHPEEAARVAAANAQLAELLTEEGISCYIHQLLHCYTSVLVDYPHAHANTHASLQHEGQGGGLGAGGSGGGPWPGLPLESFLLNVMKPFLPRTA